MVEFNKKTDCFRCGKKEQYKADLCKQCYIVVIKDRPKNK